MSWWPGLQGEKLFKPNYRAVIKQPEKRRRVHASLVSLVASILFLASNPVPSRAQIETVENSTPSYSWISHGRVDGHLALNYSPAGAFSPDGTTLAIANEGKVVLLNLREGGIRKVLKLHVEGITDLDVQSANFLTPDRLLILANGLVAEKNNKMPPRSPELAFQWDTMQDALSGKVDGLGNGGGYQPPRYFPDIRYVGLNKDNNFDLWNPLTRHGGRINLPSLTQPANLYAYSPDGHWMILAQVQGSSTADPTVVRLTDHEFVDALRGHQGTVLSIAFSRDSSRVATACEDGKVRIWSVPDWKLLQTLSGHSGAVHWVEFSPDGNWLVSAGEDKTVRVWSVADGKAAANLRESEAPILTAAFSPTGEFIAATSEKGVLMWERNKN
ncbi:MAG TPA: WD40 repeat domain-containing protein [Terriglobia bacterium]|nr:WD40 repeat domain-containing protein [Terriglobia bacterium]